MNVDQRCAFRMVHFIESSLCIRLESDLNDGPQVTMYPN